MKLAPEAKRWYRMFSQWAFIIAGALQGAWLTITPEQRDLVPDDLVNWMTGTVVVLGFIGRLIDQPKVRDAEKTD